MKIIKVKLLQDLYSLHRPLKKGDVCDVETENDIPLNKAWRQVFSDSAISPIIEIIKDQEHGKSKSKSKSNNS